MARKNIPLKDKELIKQRLAQGQSHSEAIKGTVVQSAKTAGNIKKRELPDITRMRKKYLKLIEKKADKKQRAKLWAEMTVANKIHGTNDNFIEIPDWANREKALKYIDQLAGLHEESKEAGDQYNQFNFYNIPPEELKEYQKRALKAIEGNLEEVIRGE